MSARHLIGIPIVNRFLASENEIDHPPNPVRNPSSGSKRRQVTNNTSPDSHPPTGTSSSQRKMTSSVSPFDISDNKIPSGPAPAPFSSGDLYSNLSTFSFGAASTSPRSDSLNLPGQANSFNDFISPLDPIQPDITPRPSVYASHPALRPGDPGTGSSSQRTSHEGKDHVANPDAKRKHTRPSSRGGNTAYSTPRTSDGDERAAVVHRPAEGDDVAYDRASVHTFGPGGTVPSVRSGLSSSSSSRVGHGEVEDSEALFSSDAESEIIYEEDLIPTFSVRDVDQGTADSYLLSQRRDSLPIDIPGAASSSNRRSFLSSSGDLHSRAREGSLLTLRRPSRSMDDDLRVLNASAANVGSEPQSEPLSKADWRTLDLQMQARQTGEEPTPELDLGYIFNMPSATGLVPPQIAGPSTHLDPPESRRSSVALSYVQRRPSKVKASGFTFWGRRHSTATAISAEDVFERYLGRQDGFFLERRDLWSFKREALERTESGSTPRNGISDLHHLVHPGSSNASDKGKEKEKQRSVRKYMSPGAEEIWKCALVGKFVVNMQEIAHQDPSKPKQSRLSVRHIKDPLNKSNTQGGPLQIVHKHSRAVAYSLYRAYNVYISASNRRGGTVPTRGARGRPIAPGRKPATNILLAPKSVQEEYTNTRTTSKLKDHGLLSKTEPRSTLTQRRDQHRERRAGAINAGKDDQAKPGGTRTVDDLIKEEFTLPSPTVPDEELPDIASTSAQGGASTSSQSPFVPTPSSGYSSVSEFVSDQSLLSDKTFSDQSTISDHSTVVFTSRNEGSQSSSSDDESDERPTRTPHSEVYASLDPAIVQHVRNRAGYRHNDPPPSLSAIGRFFKRLGPSTSRSMPPLSPVIASMSIESAYNPRWLVLQPRTQVEEEEQTIRGLNYSFTSVGLVPPRKPSIGQKRPSRRANRQADVLKLIPDDSLFMLLPLWPGETDSISTLEERITYSIAPDDRRYLLVHFSPFDPASNKKKRGLKKGQLRASSEDIARPSDQRPGCMTDFRGCGRLVSYDELRESGIRLPSEGLSVTGSMREAVKWLPPPLAMHYSDEAIIAVCHNVDQGVEVIPEGFSKLGLCMPISEHADPNEDVYILTPIGRAVAELTWLAGMALTSFGP